MLEKHLNVFYLYDIVHLFAIKFTITPFRVFINSKLSPFQYLRVSTSGAGLMQLSGRELAHESAHIANSR